MQGILKQTGWIMNVKSHDRFSAEYMFTKEMVSKQALAVGDDLTNCQRSIMKAA